jgi:pimeloyl-ACP methyl ester carboxylesterase
MNRLYGTPPYVAAFIHGGPGAPGSLARAAREFARYSGKGVMEPLQSGYTIRELIDELAAQLEKGCPAGEKTVLVGHSWGALLSVLYAAEHPRHVRRLVLVGCPPFEEKYVPRILQRRLARLSAAEADIFRKTLERLENGEAGALKILESLVEKTDNYARRPEEKEHVLPPDGRMYGQVWNEARKLRFEGKLTLALKRLECPVTVIHGDVDPHPAEGVLEPLENSGIPFEKFILPQCGHSPFDEREASESFCRTLERIICR